MSFLQKSDLHKHLSTSRHLPRHNEVITGEATRVILQDGNLITVSVASLEERALDNLTTESIQHTLK